MSFVSVGDRVFIENYKAYNDDATNDSEGDWIVIVRAWDILEKVEE